MTATAHTATPDRTATGITIRLVTADASDLATLAQLDSTEPLELPALVAFSEDKPLAALSLHDGRMIADPFHPTLGLIELLRIRARQISGSRTGRYDGRGLRLAALCETGRGMEDRRLTAALTRGRLIFALLAALLLCALPSSALAAGNPPGQPAPISAPARFAGHCL